MAGMTTEQVGMLKDIVSKNLKNLIEEYEKRICDVKKDYPYNKKGLLDDKKSGNEYKQMIIELIDDRKDKIREDKRLENVVCCVDFCLGFCRFFD